MYMKTKGSMTLCPVQKQRFCIIGRYLEDILYNSTRNLQKPRGLLLLFELGVIPPSGTALRLSSFHNILKMLLPIYELCRHGQLATRRVGQTTPDSAMPLATPWTRLRLGKSFPQTMLMIIKALRRYRMNRYFRQVVENAIVIFSGGRGAEKKGYANIEVCLQKLLKTHVEKMSVFESEQKLLKTKES